MDESSLLGQFEELANNLNIEVRYESLKREGSFYPGGLCTIKGENVIIINTLANPKDKVETMAKALKRFDLSQMYIRPALRDYMDGLSDS